MSRIRFYCVESPGRDGWYHPARKSQPFRNVGFVSVIIVSVLFAIGLPLVLL